MTPGQSNSTAPIGPAPTTTTTEETRVMVEQTRQAKRTERKNLQLHINGELERILDRDELDEGAMQTILEDYRIVALCELVEEMKDWDTLTTIPEPKSFLFYAKIQPNLARMLENNVRFLPYLKPFLVRFDAVNEKISPDLNAPLHYAAEALNIEFLKWLLDQPGIAVDSRNKQRKTALFLLCEQYDVAINSPKFKKRALKVSKSSAHVDDIRHCILLLLERGADFNVCSDRLKLPFELLKKNTSEDNREFLKQCIERYSCAIAISKTNELKRRVVAFYQAKAPVRITVELLELYLRFEQEDVFSTELDKFDIDQSNVREVIRLLLHTAVELNLENSVKKLVRCAGKEMFSVKCIPRFNTRAVVVYDDDKSSELTYRLELKGLLKKACECGNVATLNLLLLNISDKVLINDDPILVMTLNRAHELWKRPEQRANVLQCAELLAKDQKIFLTRTDNNGNTAVHSALKYGFHDIALDMLQQKYAFLGVKNKDQMTPLDYARYDFWKLYFDQCVTIDVRRSYFDRSEIRLSLNGFDPFIFKKKVGKKSNTRSDANLWRIVEKASASNVVQQKQVETFVTEMDPVKIIAKSKDLKRLLIHPVVYTFILVKWLRLSKWSYINLLCILATVTSFGLLSLDYCNDGEASIFITIATIIGVIYMICRECLQLLFLRGSYFLAYENYLDIATIVSIFVVLSRGCDSILSSLIVIAFAMQLTVLIGSLPFNSLSTYMYMFQTVAVNFIKSFLLFIPLLGAFTFGFYLSYNDKTKNSTMPEEDNDFNNFATFSDAALKTLIMTTGEYEGAGMDFSDGKIIIFVLFLFFAPIVILNLINGLAVSDITSIKEESELISISKKVLILERYERGVRNIPFEFIRKHFPCSFFEDHSYVIVVRPKEFRKILVQHLTKCAPNPLTSKQQQPRGGLKGDWRVVPNLPGAYFVRGTEGFFVNLRLLKFPLFSTLDDHIMDEALRIVDQSVLIREIMDNRRYEVDENPAALETDLKLEEMRLQIEKMSKQLGKLVSQKAAPTGKAPVRKRKNNTKKEDTVDQLKKVTEVARAVKKFRKHRKNK
ncbi:transient receptor potential cation channel protein painless-like [Uranotaenia lowii]|uniref:transient receptor potential cation channel protein painless-like n=1 Tax=Uranotaenia lowii TaxID=190385 RepID=UPI0024789CAB|nr:transient receptor potential cation channel protein painless-like [Uranotaenia lowii]